MTTTFATIQMNDLSNVTGGCAGSPGGGLNGERPDSTPGTAKSLFGGSPGGGLNGERPNSTPGTAKSLF